MLSKILVFVLIVSICKVESQPTKAQSTSPTNGKSQSSTTAAATAVSTTQSGTKQSSGYTTPRQTKTIPAQTSCGSTGIVASPQLQLVPGQGCIQTIPLSQLTSCINQQRGLTGAAQGYGYNAGLPGIGGIQAGQIPQLSPLTIAPPTLGLKPSLCGPSSVITGPVSSITIPPSQCATVIDNSMCNSLANALQLCLAKDFINSAACSNIISDGLPISAEPVVPGVDLNALVQTGNQICETSDQPGYYDWATILNFLNQQNEPVCPVVQPQADCAYGPELAAFVNYLTQNGKTIDQITNQQNVPCQQQGVSGNPVIDALAGYFGCSASEVSSCSYPTAPEIQFPVEIPAQLVCNYGYMPTIVPAVSFCVEPLTPDGFIIGPQCL